MPLNSDWIPVHACVCCHSNWFTKLSRLLNILGKAGKNPVQPSPSCCDNSTLPFLARWCYFHTLPHMSEALFGPVVPTLFWQPCDQLATGLEYRAIKNLALAFLLRWGRRAPFFLPWRPELGVAVPQLLGKLFFQRPLNWIDVYLNLSQVNIQCQWEDKIRQSLDIITVPEYTPLHVRWIYNILCFVIINICCAYACASVLKEVHTYANALLNNC